jgi:hypothetical protein
MREGKEKGWRDFRVVDIDIKCLVINAACMTGGVE